MYEIPYNKLLLMKISIDEGVKEMNKEMEMKLKEPQKKKSKSKPVELELDKNGYPKPIIF